MSKVVCQFVDLDNSQRSEIFEVEYSKASETINLLEDFIKLEVKEKRNLGVLILLETVTVQSDGEFTSELKPSRAPIMKFETFKKVMEQKANV